jgi:ArsR family transcriptional regulator, lead/cadmium/zinc/bismuth-responsive transcriptional repressor
LGWYQVQGLQALPIFIQLKTLMIESHRADLPKRPLPDRAAAMAEFFALLADPNRLRILDLLSAAELCVQDIAIAVGMTEAAVSQQLRYLRANRIVRHEKRGRQVFYQLADHHIMEIYRSVADHLEEHNCS